MAFNFISSPDIQNDISLISEKKIFFPLQISYFFSLLALTLSTPHLENQSIGILNSLPSSSCAVNFSLRTLRLTILISVFLAFMGSIGCSTSLLWILVRILSYFFLKKPFTTRLFYVWYCMTLLEK